MKKQRNVTSLAKGQRNSAMIERRAKGTVDRCICVHTSCFKRAGCEMRLPGLLEADSQSLGPRRHGVAVLQVSWRLVGTYAWEKSRGCWEGVAVKADALALTPRSCALFAD